MALVVESEDAASGAKSCCTLTLDRHALATHDSAHLVRLLRSAVRNGLLDALSDVKLGRALEVLQGGPPPEETRLPRTAPPPLLPLPRVPAPPVSSGRAPVLQQAPASLVAAIAGIGDLQTAKAAALAAAKARMDVVFDATRVKPGEPGFVYDTRREFEAQEDSGWDDEE